MKRIAILIALLLLPVSVLSARDLNKEWKVYSRLAWRDRPRDQIEKLHEIRALAQTYRLPDDFIRTCREEQRVYSRLNWKSTDSLSTALLEAVESYGEPLLTYRWLDRDFKYAKAHREELESSRRPTLQDRKIPFLQTRDEDDIPDDFEWVLWDRLTQHPNLIPGSEEYRLLDEKIGDRYPARPYLLYLAAKRADDRESALLALKKQYADDSFRFILEKAILDERLFQLRRNENVTETEARKLYDDAEAFAKAEKAEKGVHRRMDLDIDEIRRTLRASRLAIRFQNDSIVLTGRNFGRGVLTFRSDENHRTVSFRNRDGRFYALDTVKALIPALPDGTYDVYSEGYGARTSYEKHTLSLAARRQGEDFAVYVTDYLTGEPVPSATIRFRYGRRLNKVLEREIPMNTQGFTPLPADFQKLIGRKTYTIVEARVGERRSAPVSVFREEDEENTMPSQFHARVFKERGAYRPGDTLKVKAVLFEGDLRDRVKTLKAGKDVQVWIFNTERKRLADIDLETNNFGSIAWEWPIPEGERNGLWNIEICYKEQTLARSSFRVDDFILPTFEITFDPQEDPYMPDSAFVVKGKVEDYSGHPVDGISLEGLVTQSGREAWRGAVSIDRDGAFQIPLKLSNRGDYRLNIRALDATGETRDFEHRFTVSPSLSLKAELENAASGDFTVWNAVLVKTVLAEPVARIGWTIKNGQASVRMPVTYWLVDWNGNTLREGCASEETLELDLSDCPDGLYFLQATVRAGKANARTNLQILKVTTGLNAPVQSVFLTGETEVEYGQRIRARLGAGAGPLWAVATLSAPDGSVLESRLVHLDGVNSLDDLDFIYKGTYPDAVRLEVFYFRNAGQVVHEATYHRVRHTMDLPLTFSRFQDRTRPGAPYTLSLQTEPGVEATLAVFDKSLDAIAPSVWNRVTPLSPTFRKTWSRIAAGRISGENTPVVSGVKGPVWGVVVDVDGLPVIGATVIASGMQKGAVTDLEGHYSLDVPIGTMLEVACIGYLSAYVPAASGMQVVLEEDSLMLEEVVVVGYGVQRKSALTGSVTEALSGRVAGVQVRGASSPKIRIRGYSSVAVPEDTYVEDMPEISDDDYREVFSEALAFEPFLYPDAEGKVDVTFNTSDKLSTYHVNVFAHDPSMRNAVLREDLVVTIPVQISVTPPRYLYEEDKYVLSASVSNISNDTLSGRLYLRVEMDDAVEERQPAYAQAADLTVPANGTAAALFTVKAPPSFQPSFVGWWDEPKLDLRLVFEGDGFTDAMRLSVPVNRAEQSLTESHSALAGPEAVDSLRRMFVNLPGDKAEVTYRMLREVAEAGLEQWTAPEDPDALSRSADFYARALLGRDTTGTLAPLLALRQDDGGFAWTEGMDSSPIVTATLLERFAVLRDRGIAIPDMTETVRYLDNSQFGNWWPMWCGGLSDEQYMDIRAMWSEVPFDLTGVEEKAVRRFRLKDFRHFARQYLTPGRYDYANGWILDKARRVRTLRNLTASEAGIALGKAWGESLFTASRFEKSIYNDLISLQQYAVRHPSGGIYYPNAVLPFRGLLSSEVYAHTLLACLLDGPVSDGLKFWLILQNETQSWTGDPAYVDALQAVLTAPDSLLNRQIATLTASGSVPFADIQASGNGMRIERKFYLEEDGKRTELQTGDTLFVGDKLVARYELWSAENRSFVRVDAFREACFVPVDQLSGQALGYFGPIRVDGLWTRLPQCYRDIRADRTCWWLDVCPEESSTWEESFFITQAGTFTAPVITVESLYASQYRANAAYSAPLSIAYP